MKIAMIGHKYVPSRDGGIEIVVDELSTRMAMLNHDVTIYNRKRKFNKIKEYNGCKVKSVFTINKKSLDAIIYSFFATLKVKFSRKFDVLHYHAEGLCSFLWLLRKKKNRKIVVTIHGLDWQRAKWGSFATKILKFGERQAVKYATEIIVLSKNIEEYFLKVYNRKTTYIPNGMSVPTKHEPQLIKEEFGLTENSFVLFLARMVPEKGLHYLIDAWNNISTNIRKDLKLVIAGKSSHTDEYQNEIFQKTKGNDSIIFTGFVSGQALNELYTNTMLYVLPSDVEGMPLSLLEAMSFGNKCLVSDISENLEVINDKCFSFKKSNVEDLTNKLNNYIENFQNFDKKIYIKNSWDKVVENTIGLYSKK